MLDRMRHSQKTNGHGQSPRTRSAPWRWKLRSRTLTSLLLVPLLVLFAIAGRSDAPKAQGWWPPWAEPRAPVPREPVYRPPIDRAPPPAEAPPPARPAPPGYSSGYSSSGRAPICSQLEQRLAVEANRGFQTRDQLPRIEGEIRQAERVVQSAQGQLEQANCYEWFFFSKTLRPGRRCSNLANQVDSANRRLSDLEVQRQQLIGSSGRSLRDDIVRELARNNCGPGYQQEARNNSSIFSGLWQDGDAGSGGNRYGGVPYATYRTICVRLCDGYFFPVSFSTLPNYFDRDQEICQQKCAAPAELYYHQNPGAGMDQAVSHKTKLAYTSLRTAFRYRKEMVDGCSCKQAEYVPQGATPGPLSNRRADIGPTGGVQPQGLPRR
jgi:hypothetical protein